MSKQKQDTNKTSVLKTRNRKKMFFMHHVTLLCDFQLQWPPLNSVTCLVKRQETVGKKERMEKKNATMRHIWVNSNYIFLSKIRAS